MRLVYEQILAPQILRGPNSAADPLESPVPGWDIRALTNANTQLLKLIGILSPADIADVNLQVGFRLAGTYIDNPTRPSDYQMLAEIVWRGGGVTRAGPAPLEVDYSTSGPWAKFLRGRATLSRAVNIGLKAQIFEYV